MLRLFEQGAEAPDIEERIELADLGCGQPRVLVAPALCISSRQHRVDEGVTLLASGNPLENECRIGAPSSQEVGRAEAEEVFRR